MLEAQVLYYLNRYLGAYVKGLDPEALRISVFKGDLELRNLQLKPEALHKLKLPITVKAGLLGSLKLKVQPALVLFALYLDVDQGVAPSSGKEVPCASALEP